MENQLHTQEESISNKQKIYNSVKDNLNYIYILLMIVVNTILSLLKVENGKIGLSYPNNGLGWALWITQVILITFVGVMILGAFRRQGILQGHNNIKKVYQEYLDAITDKNEDVNPRSLKEYNRQMTISDSFTKGSILVAVNLFVMSVVVSLNSNALIALITNIFLSLCFGIKAMLEAEDFVVTELVIWYKIKTKELIEKALKKERKAIKK